MAKLHPKTRRRGPHSGFTWAQGRAAALCLMMTRGSYRELEREGVTPAARRQLYRWRKSIPLFGKFWESAALAAFWVGVDTPVARRVVNDFMSIVFLVDPEKDEKAFRAALAEFRKKWRHRG